MTTPMLPRAVMVPLDGEMRRGGDWERGERITLVSRVLFQQVFRLCIEDGHGWDVTSVRCGVEHLMPTPERMPASAFTPLPHRALSPTSNEELAAELAKLPITNILAATCMPGMELSLTLERDGDNDAPIPRAWMLAFANHEGWVARGLR